MNNLAFQIYGTKKATPFQSVWKTDNIALAAELANKTASSLPSDWALAPGGTNLLTGGYTHNGSGSSELLFSISSAAFQNYQIVCTLSAGSTGSVVIGLGNVSSASLSDSSTTIILTPTAGSGTLKITPVDFVGTVSLSVKASSSAANQIQLPISSIPVGKSIWIDWGDNSYSTMNSTNIIANRTHTYSTPGEYAVRILGDNFNFTFTNGGTNDRLKIKSISSWGKLKFSTYSFFGCSNVTMSGVTDIPDLTGVGSFQYLFGGCNKITTIGRSNEWDTSLVTSMTNTFDSCTLFNSNISNWNVSNVTNFSQMFINATSFNNGFASGVANQLPWTINIAAASVSMSSMFQNCSAFNSNLGTGTTPWDVSKVTSFSGMFGGASKFNNGDEVTQSKINDWAINTVSNVNMSGMFSSATIFNRNIGSWNVSKVTTFASMFVLARDFNNGGSPSINNWSINTASPVPMNSMFYQAYSFNQPIENWNVTSVTNMSVMFSLALAFNQPLANWERSTPGNTSTLANVTNMSQMFCATLPGTANFNQNIGNWNVSGVTNFTQMFANLSNGVNPFNNGGSISINSWQIKTNAPVTMAGMFTKSVFNQPIGDWNVSQVTDMSTMFQSTASFNQDISSWNVGNVTNMGSMFFGAIQFNRDLSRWNVGKVTIFTAMFSAATAFNNGSNSDTNPITLSTGINGWNIGTTASSVVTNQMFQNTNFNRYIGDWDVSKVTAMGNMFLSNGSFNQDLSKWNVGSVTSMEAMFYNTDAFTNGSNTNTNPVTGLTGINGWNINTSPAASVTMLNMFATNNAFNQPIGSWNVSRVTNMTSMFNGATAFNQPIGSWNVINVTTINGMFQNATSFDQDISSWNVGKVTTFQNIFGGATAFNNGGNSDTNTITGLTGINGWNINTTATSVSMNRMFAATRDFNRNINDWNVSKVTDMNEMFNATKAFNQPINSWNTVSVLGMVGMFELATAFNQPIDNWNMTNVTATRYMFNGATIFNQPLSNWERVGSTLANVTSMNQMFQNAVAFNQPIGNWNVSNVANFINFMVGKTPATFSSTNLDAIYNDTTGWVTRGVRPNITISFGGAKYTSAGATGRALLAAPPNGTGTWTIADGGIAA